MAIPIIDVRAQHHIPLGKAFSLCLKGIAHRFLRSLLTLMVIVLAVAFFMSLLCESFFARSVGNGVGVEERQERSSQRYFADWFEPVTRIDMAKRLVARPVSAVRMAEIAAITHATPERIDELTQKSRREAKVMRFFSDLDAGTRAALVGNSKDEDVYRVLLSDTAWNEFTDKLKHLLAIKVPLAIADFREVILGHEQLATDTAALAGAWQAAVGALEHELSDAQLAQDRGDDTALFVRGDPAQMAHFQQLLGKLGFAETLPDVMLVHEQLALKARQQEIREMLQTDTAQSAWHTKFLEDPLIDVKMVSLDDARVPEILGGRWSRAELAEVSRQISDGKRRREIERAVENRISDSDGASSLLSSRQAFLLAISFVVCMVGISNAMLMAITERFREIATMKCLGATDGFILHQFLIEAAIQGFAGGVAGTVIGFLLSVAKCTAIFGVYLYLYFPYTGVLMAGGICIVAGVALSTLASIYPSWMASRMAPMEAMRIE
jgi:cell division protein FtsX